MSWIISGAWHEYNQDLPLLILIVMYKKQSVAYAFSYWVAHVQLKLSICPFLIRLEPNS